MVMSVDTECRPELLAMLGSAIATCISDIPFAGPCAMTQVGMIDGEFIINPLEPKTWDEAGSPEDLDAPQTFRIRSRLSQHISFLKDFFRSYKDFSDREIDVIEIMLQKLYTRWGITDESDFECLAAEDYPVLSDLYAFIEEEY